MNFEKLLVMESEERRMEMENEELAKKESNRVKQAVFLQHAKSHREKANAIRRVLLDLLKATP